MMILSYLDVYGLDELKTGSLIQDILEKWLKIFLMTLFKDPETLIIKIKRNNSK